MVTAVTDGIEVSVEVFYYPEGSNPQLSEYLHAYRIIITNQSNHTVQLLYRHWFIWDSDGSRREVSGAGVVGEQPVLAPGASHQYMSACNLHTEFGRMHGIYIMEQKDNRRRFPVNIPAFTMTVPYKLN
ncbi:Co2+/Mg2+ efflux protein ApaG [Sphingobacteriales bacterium UPWRP_1]|nr:Co2+/Mg2+ efflux protein ApaG [Sphingobacteriales bacterium TSM_CSS]PSJ77197.1 Co2+/Mg2+ efflux protein ApaG [Sphingobacteriales bacterium UPWRP_1]